MNSGRWSKLQIIFDEALELSGEERIAYLIRCCAGDPDLLDDVDRLLRAYENNPDFLETPLEMDGDQPEFSLSERRLGAYRVVRKLGSGGMGVVYLGERADGFFKLRVAIKVVWPDSPIVDLVSRFNRERQILANMNHPNISRLIDGGMTSEGLPYMVMEYIEGERIDKYCDEKMLPVFDRMRLFLKTCEAVQYAHDHQVIHRDLKPGNILVTMDGQVKLLDFGIARVLENDDREIGDSSNNTGIPLLTYSYASPEQVSGEKIKDSSDIYSLGVVLYQLVTGHLPYRLSKQSPIEVINTINNEEPLEITGIGDREMSQQLNLLFRRVLAKRPTDRYLTVNEFAADINKILEGTPLSHNQDIYSSRRERQWRRGAGIFAIFAMIAAIILVGSFGSRLISVSEKELETTYAMKIDQVKDELSRGNQNQSVKILNEISDRRSGLGTMRNFEWGYLMKLASIPRIFNHPDNVQQSILLNGERYLLTVTRDFGRINIWDVRDSRNPIKIRDGDLIWTRTHLIDDKVLIVSAFGNKLEAEDLLTNGPPIICNYAKGGLTGAFFHGGLHTFEEDGSVRRWDLSNCRSDLVLKMVPLPDGGFADKFGLPIVVAQNDTSLSLWNLETRRMMVNVRPDNGSDSSKIDKLTFDEKGHLAAFVRGTSNVEVYDLQSGSRVLKYQDSVSIQSMLLDGAHQRLIIIHTNGVITVRSLQDRRVLRSIDLRVMPVTVKLFDNSRLMAITTNKGQLHIIDAESYENILTKQIHSKEAMVNNFEFIAGGEWMTTTGSDNTARIWSIRSLLDELPLTPRPAGQVNAIAISPDDRLTVGGGNDRRIFIWDNETRQLIRRIDTDSDQVLSVKFSPDGQRILSGGNGRFVSVWNVADGNRSMKLEHGSQVHIAIFSPDGEHILTGGSDKLIKIWDADSGRLLNTLSGHQDEITSLVYSRDGGLIVSGGYDKTLRLWNSKSGSNTGRVLNEHPSRIWSAVFSPDEGLIASIGDDSLVRIYDVTTRRLIRKIELFRSGGLDVAFTPDGKRIAIAGKDNIVRICDVSSGRELYQLTNFNGACSSLSFSKNGKLLVTGDQGGAVRFFSIN